ncbi:MAG: helix-turn-helix domain-containing protein [Actinomycetia bacterium]|nr:helix-turn-helix domain-containing protein [Actinomycetes bacterium]
MDGDLKKKEEPRNPDGKERLSPTEAARYLGVSRNTLYEAIKRHEVPGVWRMGRCILIYKQALIDAATGSRCGETHDA